MADMREYREVIKAAVKRERQADENWSWRIVSVTKSAAKIGWGYLDYIEADEVFVVTTIDDTDGDTVVISNLPNVDDHIYVFAGPNHWDNCKTIQEAIALAIHAMASRAHRIY